jgi:hypothetical protein
VRLIHILSKAIASNSAASAHPIKQLALNQCLSSCFGNPGNYNAYQAAAVHEQVNKCPGTRAAALSLRRDACFLRLLAWQA